MLTTMKKMTCRALVVSLLTLSFQGAQAGLIGAEQAGAGATTERTMLMSALDRADVAQRLQSAGVDPADARQRVAAMSDQEVRSLAQDIQTAPAGAGLDTGGWLAVIAVGALVWYFVMRR